MTSSSIEALIFLCIAVYLLYKFSVRNLDYWKKRGVPFVEPTPLVGNFLDVFMQRTTMGHLLAKLYNQFTSPYFGMYVLNKPHLVIRDPGLIKSILVKDFNYFYDRTMLSDEKCDSLTSKFLFSIKNPEWRALRTKMTPVFTTGKMKNMLQLIDDAANEMVKYLDKNQHQKSVEMKEVCAKYSTDVIATCAFGISAHSFECEDAQFRMVGRKLFDFNWKTSLRQTSYFVAPDIVQLLRIPFMDPDASDFMRDAFWKTIEERGRSKNKRNDLIDILIELRNSCKDNVELEGDTIVAQASQFFAAGFETVAATLSFTLYELCLQPDIQTKLRAEITNIVAQHGGYTYSAFQEMKYLHMVLCETLRKYPVLPFLDRMCIQDYQVPNDKLLIERGTPVYIPMFGLHYDPKYFPNPEVYDPNRFSEENKNKIPSFTYIPFGDGPRNCIGERFGLLVAKMGLAHLLSNFVVERNAETPVPLVYETQTILLASTIGLPVKIRRRASLAA